MAGHPAKLPSLLLPERVPHWDPKVCKYASAHFFARQGAMSDPAALAVNPQTVSDYNPRGRSNEYVKNSCELRTSNGLHTRAWPSKRPPTICTNTCNRPRCNAQLRQTWSQATAINEVTLRRRQTLQRIDRQICTPTANPIEFNWDTKL
jgi:hypothetical protein